MNAPDQRPVPSDHIDARRLEVFSEDPVTGLFLINHQTFDPSRVYVKVPLGSIEEWTIRNASEELHVFHLHQVAFQVAAINGRQIPFAGLQDTIDVPIHGEVTIRAAFIDPTILGRFMFHCHILEHEDKGMMAQIEVHDPKAGPMPNHAGMGSSSQDYPLICGSARCGRSSSRWRLPRFRPKPARNERLPAHHLQPLSDPRERLLMTPLELGGNMPDNVTTPDTIDRPGGRATWSRIRARGAAGMALVALVASGAGLAQQPAPPAYHPSMGDLMTMAVQPRHIKLGIAGRRRNWAYAAYEASELRNAFNRIAQTIPQYRDADTGALADADIKPKIEAVAAAIKAGDGQAFDSAYGEVTQACNACHRSLEHGFVVITVPVSNAYSDQKF